MALQALQNQRRPEQHIEVTWHDRDPDAEPSPWTPETPEEVAPPAEPPPAGARVPTPRDASDGDRAKRRG
jgi:hypothetical protein